MAEGDGKTMHEQEERRLFYVAMTRARDSLILYGKQGTGKDKTPPGLMRELMPHTERRDPGGFNGRRANSRPTYLEARPRRPHLPRVPLSGWLCRQRSL